MRIAHLSDLHVLALDGVPLGRLLTNKRLTGWANLLAGRGRHHRVEVARALARDLGAAGADHVAVTGDLSNLALEGELEAARRLLDDELGLAPDAVTVVPGNHDRYTRGSLRDGRFERVFASHLRSDLELPCALGAGPYPVVRLRGPVAIIGLATGVPRPPFVAAGEVGEAQLRALEWVLGRDEVRARLPVVLAHHPVAEARSRLGLVFEGLRDAAELRAVLQRREAGLVLHGHLHRRAIRRFDGEGGGWWSAGATSASLVHRASDRVAGYNVYDISASGRLERVSARILDPVAMRLHAAAVPLVRWGRNDDARP
jgi:3',5'-cyclic AMP phosphodiesterase CpdA